MAYKVYAAVLNRRRDERPIISLRLNGRIRLNIAATQLLVKHGVDRVRVLWDAEKRKIALTAAAADDLLGYKLQINKKGNQSDIGAKSFGAFIGLSPNGAVKVIASYSNKMLEAQIPDEAFDAGGKKKGKVRA